MGVAKRFLDWNLPALPAAADYLIERYADGSELDLSSVILVFPGRRAARRMLELLISRAGAERPAMQPPTMVTFQKFPEMLYRQQRSLADDLTQLLVWKQALSSVSAEEINAALPRIPEDDAVPAWMSLCETLRRQHNELAADGMEFDEVFEALARSGNRHEADRWKALRRIQSEYLVRMDDLQLWDRQAARLIAVQQQECHTDCDIVLVGTVDMNRIVRQMLDQVSDRVTALIHAPADQSHLFDEYGCLLAEKWLERPVNIPAETVRIVDWPADQARAVVDELAALGGTCRADDIVVGMADDHLVPAVLQHLADAGISGRWPVGMQLRNSRPFRLLTAVSQHLGSAREGQPPDFATLSDLVRHPDMSAFIDRVPGMTDSRKRPKSADTAFDWLTCLDRYLADHLQTAPGSLLGKDPQRRVVGLVCSAVEQMLLQLAPPELRPASESQGKEKKKPFRNPARQRSLYDSADGSIRSVDAILSQRLPLATWASGCLRLLSLIYRDRTLSGNRVSDRGIVACVTELQKLNESLNRMPSSVMPTVTAAQALQLLLRQISDISLPADADEQAVDLLGWLELPLDDSPILVVTGFNEGSIPESASSDLFLPNTLRAQLGLTDNNRRYARDAYAMTSIMNSRRRCVLIAGRRDSQGNPLAPSRLWFSVDPDSLPDRVRKFYEPEGTDQQVPVRSAPEGTDAVADAAGASQMTFESESAASAVTTDDLAISCVTSRSGESGFVVPKPPSSWPAPEEISVSAFRDYLNCPYRYFLRRELHLTAIDDETRELTAAAFGSLMHEVLNRFGKSPVCHATSEEAIEVFLLTEIQKLAAVRFGRQRSATVSVQLKMLENRLQQFARWQADSNAQGWRITHTEADLRYDDFRDIKDRAVVLTGRVDRIDQHLKTGEWRILDYKTSETAEKPESTHRKRDEWTDLQLPLYRLLVRSLEICGDLQLGYVHLPGDLSKIGCSIADWTVADLESAERRAREVAADILDLKIDRVASGNPQRTTEFSRVCQETVIGRQIPWLNSWPGRTAPK